jgi:hypothetical protein
MVSKNKALVPVARPPMESSSRRIQRQHVRRYEGHVTLVNKGLNRTVVGQKPLRQRPIPVISPREMISVRPRDVDWKTVLPPQKANPMDNLRWEIRKIVDDKGVELLPGEVIAARVLKLYRESPMSTIGEFEILTADGERIRLPIETKMSQSSLIDWLIEAAERKVPLIIGMDAEIFSSIRYARVLDKIPEDKITSADGGFMEQQISPVGKGMVARKFDRKGHVIRSKKFNTLEEYHEAYVASLQGNRDIYGDRWDPQLKLKEALEIAAKRGGS